MSHRRRKPISRRHILRGAAGIALALPAIEGIEWALGLSKTKVSKAQEQARKRFITVFRPNGTVQPRWPADTMVPDLFWPIQQSNGPLIGPSGVRYGLNQSIAPLTAVASNLHMIRGVNLPTPPSLVGQGGNAGAHWFGITHLLTGAGSKSHNWTNFDANGNVMPLGPSIDNVLAASLSNGQPQRKIYFATQSGSGGNANHVSFEQNGSSIVPSAHTRSVLTLFDNLFSDHLTDGAQLDAIRQQRGSVLDAVISECNSLSARKLGTRGRQQLEAHCDHLRDIEKRIAIPVQECRIPTKPGSEPAEDQKLDVVANIIAAAIACNITSVANIQYGSLWGNYYNFPIPKWNNPSEMTARNGLQATEHHEGLSHQIDVQTSQGGNIRTEVVHREQWICMQLVRLAQRLKEYPDASGGTVFDNTLIFATTEVSQGKHGFLRMPFILIGGTGSGLRGGRYTILPDATSSTDNGVTNNRLLVSIMNAMGKSGSTFGHTDWSAGGPISGIFG